MNKKGMEFAVGTFVTLILGIAMFGAGVAIFYNVYDNTVTLNEEVDSKIRQDILARFDDGSKVFIPESVKNLRRADSALFHFGVHNINSDTKSFEIEIETADDFTSEYIETEQEINGNSKKVFMFLVKVAEGKEPDRGQHPVTLKINILDGGNPSDYATRIVYVTV